MNFKVSEQNRSLETLIDPSLYLTLNWYLDIREWFLFVVKFFKWEQTFFLFLLFLFLLFFRLFHGDVRFRGITVFFTFFATARFLEQNPAVWGSFVIFIWKIRLHFLLFIYFDWLKFKSQLHWQVRTRHFTTFFDILLWFVSEQIANDI